MSDKWTAVQRRFARHDWLVVDERGIVVATVSPETYWETDDPVAAQTRAHLLAVAPEMADILREIAQLPQLLDGTDRLAVVITADLRQRVNEVLLRLNGYDEWPY